MTLEERVDLPEPGSLLTGKETTQKTTERGSHLPATPNPQAYHRGTSSEQACVPLINRSLGTSRLGRTKLPFTFITNIYSQASMHCESWEGKAGPGGHRPRALDQKAIISESDFSLFLGQRMQERNRLAHVGNDG